MTAGGEGLPELASHRASSAAPAHLPIRAGSRGVVFCVGALHRPPLPARPPRAAHDSHASFHGYLRDIVGARGENVSWPRWIEREGSSRMFEISRVG